MARSLMVIAPPDNEEFWFGDAAASPTLLPWQIVAEVGDIVGAVGGVSTVINTLSVEAAQGLAPVIVQRNV